MGLAASQARLLFITNRQNDVSAKMQRISNENLILARDAEDLDEKFKQMKNRETYEIGGVDVSYDALMGSQAVTNGSLVLLQNAASGAVVLSPSLASKLGLEGVGNGSAFKSKWGDQTAFIAKMTGMSADSVRTILTELSSTTTNTQTPESDGSKLSINGLLAGFGGKSSSNFKIDASGNHWAQGDLTLLGGAANFDSGTGGFWDKVAKTNAVPGYFNSIFNIGSTANNNMQATVDNSTGAVTGLFGYKANRDNSGDGTDVSNVTFQHGTMNIADLYKAAGTLEGALYLGSVRRTTDWKTPPSFDTAISKFGAVVDGIKAGFKNVLEQTGFNSAATKIVDSTATSMFNKWSGNTKWDTTFYTQQAGKLGKSWNDQDFNNNEDSLGVAMMACTGNGVTGANVEGIVAASNDDDGPYHTWDFTVDIGTFVKNLVNQVMSKLTDGQCADTSSVVGNKYNTTEQYTINVKYTTSDAQTETPKTQDEVGKANVQFYRNMYNEMKKCGYQVDENVNSSSYLNEKLQNNQYYVDQKPVASNSKFTKGDTEKIKEEAKEFYEMEKAKITRKEKQLDSDLAKLQTEYSALTNDYNSVKGLIDQNIQRSFTYCSQG